MIDNFNKIKPLLSFKNEGDFYFIQILKRRKDNSEMERDMQLIDNYFVYSFEDYENKKQRITDQCTYYNARAYIRLNVRNTKKIALKTLGKISDLICNGDYHAVKNAYLSACGEFHSQDVKRWIVDLDGVDPFPTTVEKINTLNTYINWINDLVEPEGPKVLDVIPTKNGCHIICTPFNVQQWYRLVSTKIDIHKDNPTILYIP